MWEDVLGFKVLFFSQDGKTSPVLDYLLKMTISSKEMSLKIHTSLEKLQVKIYEGQDIKHIKIGKVGFYEFKVQNSTNIVRFFFIIENKSIVIFHGFTKKSQKIENKEIRKGLLNLQEYKINNLSIEYFKK